MLLKVLYASALEGKSH